MTTAASGLRELHQLHIEHTDVLDQLEAGPRKVRAREALTVKRQADVEMAQHGLTDLRKASDERGLQLKVNETKLADLRSKLNAASSNREFGIIQGQIEADVAANAVLEDEILELFDRVDTAQCRVGEVEVQREAATVEYQRSMEEVAAAESGLEQQRDKLKQASFLLRDCCSARGLLA